MPACQWAHPCSTCASVCSSSNTHLEQILRNDHQVFKVLWLLLERSARLVCVLQHLHVMKQGGGQGEGGGQDRAKA